MVQSTTDKSMSEGDYNQHRLIHTSTHPSSTKRRKKIKGG